MVKSNPKAPGGKTTFRSQVPSKTKKTLTRPVFHQALKVLKDRDPDLGHVLAALGPPPLWQRDPGFPTLVRIILEQQVSLSSARAAFNRLLKNVPTLTPEKFLEVRAETLRQIGFSRQKAYYCGLLAESIMGGLLNLERLKTLDDDRVRAELIKIKGIGRWTADIYLLTALRRPNIWPLGDLALAAAVRQVKRLRTTPSAPELEDMSHIWEPWRAVAARIFWHHYLSTQNKNKGKLKRTPA
jgi:DNA-3-methyladenine glycosylase II